LLAIDWVLSQERGGALGNASGSRPLAIRPGRSQLAGVPVRPALTMTSSALLSTSICV
jgi:hypothetical protein